MRKNFHLLNKQYNQKIKMYCQLIISFIFMFFYQYAFSQDDAPLILNENNVPADSILKIDNTIDTLVLDTLKHNDSIDKIDINKTVLWSLLPSAGHIYSRQYSKVPIYGGGMAAITFFSVKRRLDYQKHYNAYTDVLENLAFGNSDSRNLDSIRQKKQAALRDFNRSVGVGVAFYGLSIIDAYLGTMMKNTNYEHSPVKAAYRSIILPGWGQAYNQQYWKIPVVYAGLGAAGFGIYYTNKQYNTYTQEYLTRTRPNYGIADPDLDFLDAADLLVYRQRWRRYFEISIISASAWYLIVILDATIQAHLFDFDVSDDLSFQVRPFLLPSQMPFSTKNNGSFNHNSLGFTSGLSVNIRF
ncbi:MAG: DUF5683 domain-containing protein [Chitinophagales bacterium]